MIVAGDEIRDSLLWMAGLGHLGSHHAKKNTFSLHVA